MASTETPNEIPTENLIVVQGYSHRYARAVRHLLGIEGGYVNDPVDRGGATKYGISLRFLVGEGQIDLDGDGIADFDLDMDGDIDGADIRKLTVGDAIFLYHRCFWQRLDAEGFAEPIGEMMFDQAVNGGLVAARKLLQRAISRCLAESNSSQKPAALNDDGALGEKTRAAFDWVLRWNSLGVTTLVANYRRVVKDRYRAIVAADPSQQRFLRGWLRRADLLGQVAADRDNDVLVVSGIGTSTMNQIGQIDDQVAALFEDAPGYPSNVSMPNTQAALHRLAQSERGSRP